MKKSILFILILVVIGGVIISLGAAKKELPPQKLYWFIPDGMRADREEFKVFEWAREGKLPNIKKMMDRGVYGYSIPVFPSHTPTNFATLLTGAYPSVHGVADGPMHVEGFPLAKPSAKGFASTAKKVAPIWTVLESVGKKVALLSIPGSTPPELKNGITIRGRWGGWGADTHSVVYEPKENLEERKKAGRGFRLFFLGPNLTKFIPKSSASGWADMPKSFSPAKETTLEEHGLKVFGYIYDATDDQKQNYNHIMFALDKSKPETFIDLTQGSWSDWIPVQLKFQNTSYDSNIKIKIIKLWETGNFRVRVLYNALNRFITEPSAAGDELTKGVGPMVDFADNWPPQLIYESEDKDTFLEEARMSWEWHKKAVPFIYKTYNPDVFIQDIYTPNLMLESRWWHRLIDKSRKDYDPKRAEEGWRDILEMYQGLDAIMGEAMKSAPKDSLFVLSSDHGVCPLERLVKINNLFAKKGWLKFTVNKETGEPIIDWKNTKVIYLKMAHVYVHPNGLGGDWKRGSGPAYEKLRKEVIEALRSLEDVNGVKPVVQAVPWEDAPKFFELPTDRVGDIVIEVKPRYFWDEEVNEGLEIFADALTSGYKQSIDPKNMCMWTPFIITGPGVKKNVELKDPVNHIDQMPTILQLMGVDIPDYVQGKSLEAVQK